MRIRDTKGVIEAVIEDIKISVIVPVYNEVHYLDTCIYSICNQTYRNLEIIIVDDGSSSPCCEMCDDYSRKDKRIKVIHKKNGGSQSARREGIEVATGDYITFVDSDDWIELDFYKVMVDVAQKYNSDMITATNYYKNYSDGHYVEVYDNKKNEYWVRNNFEEKVFPYFIKTDTFFDTDYPIAIWTSLFKRDFCRFIVRKVGNDIRTSEDYIFLMIAFLNANSFSSISYRGYHYRSNINSKTYTLKNVKELLRPVYETVENAIDQSDYDRKNLRKKNKLFMFHTLMLKEYKEIIKLEHNFLFPFPKITKGSKVLIYGAGQLGKQIYSVIKDSTDYKISGIADKNWKLYKEQGIDVISPEKIFEREFDYVIIAITYVNVKEQVKKSLIEWGIPADKFAEVDINLMNDAHLPFINILDPC